MIGVRYVFVLDGESPIETEGELTTGRSVAAQEYSEGDHFRDKHAPTYIIEGQSGGYVVRKSDVREILAIEFDEGGN